MKKILLTLAATFIFCVGTGYAAPINYMATGQTAVGIGTDTFFLKHKFSDGFTLGYQSIDLDHGYDSDDIYGDFALSRNVGLIVGARDFDSETDAYVGVGVHAPLAPKWDGYAFAIGCGDFKEMQVGANFMMTGNLDLNLYYRSFQPDLGDNQNKFGAAVTYIF
ncbi:MAG: hypothetical protein H6Q73_1080 [Firmicutes bacterium]|nr:hypothetical protein [Bacillota bacterium]